MYAVIQSGSKQHKIEEGTILNVELMQVDKSGNVEFKEVLLLNDGKEITIGNPLVKNCIVKAQLVKETKGPKVIAYKYKLRKNYHKKIGHRQKYLKVKITKIQVN